jgi:hypothetical protein
MPITLPVYCHAAFIISAACQRPPKQFQSLDRSTSLLRVGDADKPGTAIGMGTDDADITTEIDESMRNIVLHADRGGPVCGIFLDDTPQVQLHPCSTEFKPGFAPVQTLPPDNFQNFADGFWCRQLPAPEIPDPAQHPRADIEEALTLLPAGLGIIQQVGGFFINLQRATLRRHTIDRGKEAGLKIA